MKQRLLKIAVLLSTPALYSSADNHHHPFPFDLRIKIAPDVTYVCLTLVDQQERVLTVCVTHPKEGDYAVIPVNQDHDVPLFDAHHQAYNRIDSPLHISEIECVTSDPSPTKRFSKSPSQELLQKPQIHRDHRSTTHFYPSVTGCYLAELDSPNQTLCVSHKHIEIERTET